MSRIHRVGASRPVVSICVPTLDRKSGRVARLLESVDTHTQVPYETVVYDCEGRVEGYTTPMNAAMWGASGEYLLAVNDDVVLAPDWFRLLKAPLSPPSGVWCTTPDATHTDGPQIFHPWCMLFTRRGWDAIGGLDPQFGVWCSDIDLARRLVDAGRPPVKVKLPVPIIHQLNATSAELPQIGEICLQDLAKFQAKWGVHAEDEKHRLAALCE